jgi:hypothetical protein
MRGYCGKRDRYHGVIRDGLRACKYSVEDTADAGKGFPDLVVGAYGVTFMLEVKSEGKKETAEQAAKRTAWKGGPWLVVRSLDEALREIWKHRSGAIRCVHREVPDVATE